MEEIRAGQSYISYRQEIVGPKPKYHLYLADDIVFLINSEKSLFDFNISLQKNDCPILTKDCYLQLQSLYRFDEKQKIIALADMSDRALMALSSYLKDKTFKKAIPKIFVDRAIGIIEQCLTNRNNQ